MNVNRREAMGKIVGFAGMAAGAAVISPAVFAADECPVDGAIGVGSEGSDLGTSKLVYVELDPMAVAKLAYEGYGRAGCMYGVFDAIVRALGTSVSEDACNFAAIPTNLAVYGGGGINGWGTVCGCLNATGMIVNVLSGIDKTAVINAMYRYYEKTSMPRGDDAFLANIGAPTRKTDDGALLTADKIGQSIANSILCHTSVSHWSSASQYGSHHAAKAERCAQITAEVAFKTVEFLNMSLAGTLAADDTIEMHAEGNDSCNSCHAGSGAEPDTYLTPEVNSNMECQTCHAPHDEIAKIPHHAEESCSTCHPK